MMNNPYPESDLLHHTQKMKDRFRDLVDHLREDIGKVDEPQIQAVFETSAEVLNGLIKTLEDYEKKNEEAWQSSSSRR